MSPEYQQRLGELRRETQQHERQLRVALGDLERAVPRPMEELEQFLHDNGAAIAAGAFLFGLLLGARRA